MLSGGAFRLFDVAHRSRRRSHLPDDIFAVRGGETASMLLGLGSEGVTIVASYSNCPLFYEAWRAPSTCDSRFTSPVET